MPYPNEHACRLRQPNGNTTRRVNGGREHNGKKYDVIYQKTDDGKMEEQAYRYPKGTWDAVDAKAHCSDHKGLSFEAATGGESMVQLVRTKGVDGEYGPLREMSLADVVAWFKVNSDAEGNVADGIVLYGDVLLKAAPKEAQEDELFDWVMSDYTLDRDMERIDPAGWDLKNYRKNPVVLWGHNSNIPAIGVALDTGVDKDKGLLVGRIKFSSKEVDPFAWMIKEKIREGILKTGSVGFRPVKVEIVDQSDDGKGTKPSEQARLIHRKQELYEFSIVNIPANPNAALRRMPAVSIPSIWVGDLSPVRTSTTVASTFENGDAIESPPAHDGAWSVRGKGYKQQDDWVDSEHAVMQKEIKDIIEVLAQMRKETESEEVVLEKADEPVTKAADGVLADMALRLDDIEDLIKGLIDRVGVAEPESTKPEFYEELFKRSRPTPSALDKLLMPAKNIKE